MRTASLALGITGGVFGVIAGLLALLISGLGASFDDAEFASAVPWAFFAVFLGVVGIVGGALAPRQPKVAAGLQITSAVLGFVAIFLFWIFSAILLFVGGLLAFLGRNS